MKPTNSKIRQTNERKRFLSGLLFWAMLLIGSVGFAQGVILQSNQNLQLEPEIIPQSRPEFMDGMVMPETVPDSQLTLHVETFSMYDYMVINLRGGDNPGEMKVRIVDPRGMVHLWEENFEGRRLQLSTEMFPKGKYIAKLVHQNEVVLRQSFLINPY